MRIPLFGFVVADPAHASVWEDHARAALTEAGHNPACLIIGAQSGATGDAVKVEQGLFAYAGVLPDVADPATTLQEFVQAHHGTAASARQVPEGSFVLAWRDAADPGSLLLATDKFGTIPLFYIATPEGCWFSSDQTLLFGLDLSFRLRPLSLPEGLHRLVPPPPLTHFNELRSLPLSTCVRIMLPQSTEHAFRYHAIEESVDPAALALHRTRSDADLADTLEEALSGAVRASVAPYDKTGVLLSGGVDSSLLSVFAAQHTDLVAVHIDQPDGDSELVYAQSVARQIGIELHVVEFTSAAFRQNFVRAVWEQAQSFFIANGMALQYTAQSGLFDAAEILIDGEGADFPMYSSGIQKNSLWRFFLSRHMRLPDSLVDRALSKLTGLTSKLGYAVSVPRKGDGLHETLCARTIEDAKLYRRFHTGLTHINDPLERDLAAQVVQGYESSLQNVLTRLDPASRLAGKHTVFPYLHPDYIDVVMNLPASVKLRRARGLKPRLELKWLVKKVAERHLPHDAMYRPKVGFGMPAGTWLGTFPDGYHDGSWIKATFELSDSGFDHLLHSSGQSQNLYFLTALETWGRLFDRREALADVEARFSLT